jgi:hypothetical protein
MFDRRIGGGDPAVAVFLEPDRIVQIHLDEILVEAVGAAAPAAVAIDELAVGEPYIGPQEARERLA